MRGIILLLCNICLWVGQCSKCGASDPPLKPFVLRLDTNWRFAQDEGDQSAGKEWYSENFNDTEWRVLKSGTSWERQGVTHQGFGWYRQKCFIPEEYAGIPVVFTLGSTQSDDDLYINGIRVGGIKGPYKYNNWLQRTYTISPSVLHYGKLNTIAIRVWGGNLILTGSNSGLMPGPYTAELDPYRPTAKSSEAGQSEEQNIELFDFSAAQAGRPFEMVFHFPEDMLRSGSEKLTYTITDYYGGRIAGGTELIYLGKDGVARGVVKVNQETAQTIYLRGRFKANLTVSDDANNPLYSRIIEVDHLSFARRDTLVLPSLTDTYEETPYGRLKLIDEVDCSLSLGEEPHPYLQSGFDKAQMRNTPGSAVNVTVSQILGKSNFPARGNLKPP